MKLSPLRDDSRLRRRVLLYLYGALGFAAVAATGLLAWVIPLLHPVSLANRLAEIGDVLIGGTLVLALIAALVALQAYAATTGLPDLKLQVTFPLSTANRPRFWAYLDEPSGNLWAKNAAQISPAIRVRNLSGYSARNPAIIIRLKAMAFSPDELAPGWTQVDFAQTDGITAVQWDGGTFSIHGRSERRLPALYLTRLHTRRIYGKPRFVIELLAEGGYRREIEIPVLFAKDEDEFWAPQLPAGDQLQSWL